eukprot:1900929-Prymnesium_polylepis.1
MRKQGTQRRLDNVAATGYAAAAAACGRNRDSGWICGSGEICESNRGSGRRRSRKLPLNRPDMRPQSPAWECERQPSPW